MIQLLQGDCRAILPTLEPGSVQCCVTSPPYWGLRDYGTAQWEGGYPWCDHLAGSDYGTKNDTNNGAIRGGPFKTNCRKCGARRIDSQLGLEESPSEYITKMVAVFREVWRLLRDDGTLWVNMGDSYASPNGWRPEDQKTSTLGPNRDGLTPGNAAFIRKPKRLQVTGLKPKDLCGIPWRLAFALQADGWYLRSDIIWHKPNPMPESVTDRPTKAHEYIFLLTKSERYFYDAGAIREPGIEPERERWDRIGGVRGASVRHSEGAMVGASSTRNKRSVWTIPTQPGFSGAVSYGRSRITSKDCPIHGCQADRELARPNDAQSDVSQLRRNPGNNIDPFQAELFSAPAKNEDHRGEVLDSLVAISHSSETRRKEESSAPNVISGDKSFSDIECIESSNRFDAKYDHKHESKTAQDYVFDGTVTCPSAEILDHKTDISCTCKYGTVVAKRTDHFAQFPEEIPKLCILAGSKPGDTILDPFCGSGTVGKVALELGRRAVLIELNPDYIELAQDRTNVTPGFF